ncbi:hypothetical protein [Absidia glauca]|uniref:Uncharacterized protein n=1 Tax=Absidia glauca TaxID=4829 RepID=A0A168R8P4_ABSGL|nr:hypothetical protein [Absidia glauca]
MNCTESSLNFALSLNTYTHTTVYYNDLFRVRRTSQSLARPLAALQSTLDTLAQDVAASFRRLQQDLAAEQEGAGAMLIPTPYAPARAAYSKVVSSTMAQYTTNLTNRLTADLGFFWMTSLYSMRLRQLVRTIPSAQRPALTKGDADKLGLYITAWGQERNQPLLPPSLPPHWKAPADAALRHSIQASVKVCKQIMQEHFPEHPDFSLLGTTEDDMIDRGVACSSFRELLDAHRDSFDELQQISGTHGSPIHHPVLVLGNLRKKISIGCVATQLLVSDNQVATVFFENDTIGNRACLNTIRASMEQRGVRTDDPANMQPLHISLFSQHIHLGPSLLTTYACTFNETQIDLADIVQVVPPPWCARQVSGLPESSQGRRWKPIRDSSFMDHIGPAPPVRQQAAIAISHQYLQAIQGHGDTDGTRAMFQQTFRPELDHLVRLQRLFNLVPAPSFTKKHIKIELQTIKKLFKKEGLHQYANQDAWTNVFDFNRIKNVRDMTFAGHLYTDGFSI